MYSALHYAQCMYCDIQPQHSSEGRRKRGPENQEYRNVFTQPNGTNTGVRFFTPHLVERPEVHLDKITSIFFGGG